MLKEHIYCFLKAVCRGICYTLFTRGVSSVQGSYFGGLLVAENLRVDSVELQDEFVHQLRVQPTLSFEEGTVLSQLLLKTVCSLFRRDIGERTSARRKGGDVTAIEAVRKMRHYPVFLENVADG